MARAPRPGRCKTRLEPLLGPEGCARLQAALVGWTAAWAVSVGDAFLAVDPPDAVDETAALAPAGTTVLAQEGEDLGERLVRATAAVHERHPGPQLVVGTDMVRLGLLHVHAALADLAEGYDAAIGPALDGGYYLVALARPLPALFALPPEAWGGPEVLPLTLGLAREAGLEVGILRPERDLDTPQDVRAALADPLFPAEIAALLRTPS